MGRKSACSFVVLMAVFIAFIVLSIWAVLFKIALAGNPGSELAYGKPERDCQWQPCMSVRVGRAVLGLLLTALSISVAYVVSCVGTIAWNAGLDRGLIDGRTLALLNANESVLKRLRAANSGRKAVLLFLFVVGPATVLFLTHEAAAIMVHTVEVSRNCTAAAYEAHNREDINQTFERTPPLVKDVQAMENYVDQSTYGFLTSMYLNNIELEGGSGNRNLAVYLTSNSSLGQQRRRPVSMHGSLKDAWYRSLRNPIVRVYIWQGMHAVAQVAYPILADLLDVNTTYRYQTEMLVVVEERINDGRICTIGAGFPGDCVGDDTTNAAIEYLNGTELYQLLYYGEVGINSCFVSDDTACVQCVEVNDDTVERRRWCVYMNGTAVMQEYSRAQTIAESRTEVKVGASLISYRRSRYYRVVADISSDAYRDVNQYNVLSVTDVTEDVLENILLVHTGLKRAQEMENNTVPIIRYLGSISSWAQRPETNVPAKVYIGQTSRVNFEVLPTYEATCSQNIRVVDMAVAAALSSMIAIVVVFSLGASGFWLWHSRGKLVEIGSLEMLMEVILEAKSDSTTPMLRRRNSGEDPLDQLRMEAAETGRSAMLNSQHHAL